MRLVPFCNKITVFAQNRLSDDIIDPSKGSVIESQIVSEFDANGKDLSRADDVR